MAAKKSPAKKAGAFGSLARIPSGVYMMYGVLFFFFVGTAAFEFSIGPFLENTVESLVLLSWLLALPFLLGMISNIYIGEYSDRKGALFMLKVSLLAAVAVAFGFVAVTSDLNLLFAIPLLLLWGVMYQGVAVPSEAYIRKKARGKLAAKAIGFMEAVIYFGFVVGPISAGYLLESELFREIFYFYAATAFVALAMMFGIKRVRKFRKAYRLILKHENIFLKAVKRFSVIERGSHHTAALVLVIGFIVALWDGIIWFTVPFLYIQGLIDAISAGLLEAVFMVTSVGVLPFSGFIVERLGRYLTILSGFLLATVFSFLFVLFIPNVPLMAVYAFFIALGVSIAFPIAESLLTDLGYKKEMGVVSGIYNMAKSMGYVVGTALTGVFVILWAGAPFFFTGFLFILVVSLTVAFMKGDKKL